MHAAALTRQAGELITLCCIHSLFVICGHSLLPPRIRLYWLEADRDSAAIRVICLAPQTISP
jgi:hypothetical protein